MEAIQAATILVEEIQKNYSADISFVVIMGSYVYHETHEKSDIDLFYHAKTERGRKLAHTFIIDGVGFDFWDIPLERLENIADYGERVTSILTEGQVLYYGSDEDRVLFEGLRNKALDVSDHRKFVRRAEEELEKAHCFGFDLQICGNDLSAARKNALGIIYLTTYAIALLNRSMVKRGRGKLKQEILEMALVPEDFVECYDTVFYSKKPDEIRNAYTKLLQNTGKLAALEREKIFGTTTWKEQLTEFYEELINWYNKIDHAYAIGDSYTLLFAAVELENELTRVFSNLGGVPKELPDLVGSFDPENPKQLADLAHIHQKRFEQLLSEHGVPVRRFADFEELKRYLSSL